MTLASKSNDTVLFNDSLSEGRTVCRTIGS
jgi:hypothetical protein